MRRLKTQEDEIAFTPLLNCLIPSSCRSFQLYCSVFVTKYCSLVRDVFTFASADDYVICRAPPL